jgi:hypothetical protein
MPALISHDTFGMEIFEKERDHVGDTRDALSAFLLGCQGPDPMLYSVTDPGRHETHEVADVLHDDSPDAFLLAFDEASGDMPYPQRVIAHAYELGFLCHFELDSAAHPLVYAQQLAYCNAGVPGLSPDDGNVVHALIERELDEVVLFTRRHQTIETFNPSTQILRGSQQVLDLLSDLYVRAMEKAYDLVIPDDTYSRAVHAFRRAQHFFYSPRGIKHEAIGRLEKLGRNHSFYHAISHENVRRTTSEFANDEHAVWTNPFTGACETKSFIELFEEAERKAIDDIERFDEGAIGVQTMRQISRGLDFSGKPID